MWRLVGFMALALLTACGQGADRAVHATGQPSRIVSLDYCADQYLLKFVDRSRILAISPDADEKFSYMREAARDLPTVRPQAEDVLVLKPDLVVRSYGGGPNAVAFFERAGIPVLNLSSWAADIPSVMANVESTAMALGAEEEGRRVVANMKQRLDALAQADGNILYMTPGGVTTGPGTLVHELIEASGRQNFQREAGWNPIPLERLAYEQPDRVAASFFDTLANSPDAWSPMKHPVARAQLRDRPVVALDGSWTSCGGWYLVEAVEAMAAEDIE
ncbi:MAG: ABC transporter substrate-binding protein [Parvularculaceae bacterium]|nr:ABC transporter substrate-binding protein [Parvularculaceae bacterium]